MCAIVTRRIFPRVGRPHPFNKRMRVDARRKIRLARETSYNYTESMALSTHYRVARGTSENQLLVYTFSMKSTKVQTLRYA